MKKRVLLFGLFVCFLGVAVAQDRPFEKDPNTENGGGFGNKDLINNSNNSDQPKGGLKNGKLLDDSTKNIYGPTTTKYTFERNIKFNQPVYFLVDTLIDNLHRFNYVNRNKNEVQDLGNIGTAAMPMFFQLPTTIGARSGISVYDRYFKTSDEIKYYDTHSPFSNMDVVIGGNGRAITNVNYSRNINTQWNFGFDFRGLFIDKQIERAGKGDRDVFSNAYNVYTHYQNEDKRYQLLAHLSRNKHQINESGGILVEDSANPILYFEDNTQRILRDAKAEELKTNMHLYQQYKFTDLIQIYQQTDRSKQQNTFKDLPSDSAYHKVIFLDPAVTRDRIDFHSTTYEQGVKGDMGRLFYNFYYKARYFDIDYENVNRNRAKIEDLEAKLVTRDVERYAGAHVRLHLDSLTNVTGKIEYLVGSNYQIEGEFQSSKYSFGFKRMQYEPSFVEKFYYGNHDQWFNEFSPTKADEFKGDLNLKFGSTTIKPFSNWKLLNDYIYYDTVGVPQQVSDLQLLRIGTSIHTSYKDKLHLTIYGSYSSVQGNNREVMRVPEILVNAKIYYENIVYDGNLQFQIGVDVHWRSEYYANAYDPAIQQYRLQDDFIIGGVPIIDLFANLKINRGRLFVKYINLGKAFSETGYFATPGYIGQINLVDFGFKWAFYD